MLAFGSPVVFVEKYLPRVKHIEVQLLGDQQGQVVHLHERDCLGAAPLPEGDRDRPRAEAGPELKQRICDDALKLARGSGYTSAGTAEFLVYGGEHYFIEVKRPPPGSSTR